MNSSQYEDYISSSTTPNLSVSDYLLSKIGPQRISYGVLIPITIVYIIIFVTGIVGNISTVIVIARTPRMHTATNFYLISLAISDLVTLLLGLPNDLFVYWHQYPYIFGEVVCAVRALISEMTSNASVLTIMAFTVERYFAICHPLKVRVFSKLTRALIGIGWIWFLGLVSAIPFAVYSEVSYIDYPQNSGNLLVKSAFCRMTTDNGIIVPILQFSSFVFFVLPMILISCLYILIARTLNQNSVKGRNTLANKAHDEAESKVVNVQLAARKSIIKMLVAVVVAFFICFAPYHAQRLFSVYIHPNNWTNNLRLMNEILFYVAGCLYFLSCTINPILYNVMSAKYRKAFKATVCAYCLQNASRNDLHLSAYYHSSVYRGKRMNGTQTSITKFTHTESDKRKPEMFEMEAQKQLLQDSPKV